MISATEPFSTLGPSGASEYGSNTFFDDAGHAPFGGGLLVTPHQYLLESVVHQLVAQSARKPVSGLTACAPDFSARLKLPLKLPILNRFMLPYHSGFASASGRNVPM